MKGFGFGSGFNTGRPVLALPGVHVHGHSFVFGTGDAYSSLTFHPVRHMDGRFADYDETDSATEGQLSASGYGGESAQDLLDRMSDGSSISEIEFGRVFVIWAARNSVIGLGAEAVIAIMEDMRDIIARKGNSRWLFTECPLKPSEDTAGPGDPDYDEVVAYNALLASTFGADRVVAAQALAVDYPDGTNHMTTDGYLAWAKRLGDKVVANGWLNTALPSTTPTKCLETAASLDFVNLKDYPEHAAVPTDPTADHTALIWYKGTDTGGCPFGRNDGGSATNSMGLLFISGTVRLRLGGNLTHTPSVAPWDGNWHLIGWRVSGGVGQLIIDGQLVGSTLVANALSGTTPPWYIGDAAFTAFTCLGRYSGANIWRRALTADEILSVYNDGTILAQADLPQQDDLVVSMTLGEHRGRIDNGFIDRTGNVNGFSVAVDSADLVDDYPGSA